MSQISKSKMLSSSKKKSYDAIKLTIDEVPSPAVKCRSAKILTLVATVLIFLLFSCIFYLVSLSQSILFQMQLQRNSSPLHLKEKNGAYASNLNIMKKDPRAGIHSAGGEVNILIVYSQGAALAKFANEVEAGCRSLSPNRTNVRKKLVVNSNFQDVMWADAIILGSRVLNANVDPQLQGWIDAWDFKYDMSNKVGAVFVTAGGISAGQELTMVNLLHSMLIFRMVIVGGDKWTYPFGASEINGEGPFGSFKNESGIQYPAICYQNSGTIMKLFLRKAFGLGRRVNRITRKIK